jgi:hypothetical protein
MKGGSDENRVQALRGKKRGPTDTERYALAFAKRGRDFPYKLVQSRANTSDEYFEERFHEHRPGEQSSEQSRDARILKTRPPRPQCAQLLNGQETHTRASSSCLIDFNDREDGAAMQK